MQNAFLSRFAVAFLGVAAAAAPVLAQSSSPASASNPAALYDPRAFPLQLRNPVTSLGSRLQQSGQEREVLTGSIVQSGVTLPAVVTFQLPNQIRIDLQGATPRSIGYDGTQNWSSSGTVSSDDESMLESVYEDSPEGMLYGLHQSASIRVVATNARWSDPATPTVSLAVDLDQVVLPVLSSSAKPTRQKQYVFDSNAHVLIETDYYSKASDGSTVAVRVKRSNWTSTGGQASPGSITRTENGNTIFTFTSAGVAFSAAANDGTFAAP